MALINMNIAPHKAQERSMFKICKSTENNKPSRPRSRGDFQCIVIFPSHQKDSKLVDNYEKK
jgi:hypothetical protein